MKQIKLTEKERELIEAIRNYKLAYPNGSYNLEAHVWRLVDELMDR